MKNFFLKEMLTQNFTVTHGGLVVNPFTPPGLGVQVCVEFVCSPRAKTSMVG